MEVSVNINKDVEVEKVVFTIKELTPEINEVIGRLNNIGSRLVATLDKDLVFLEKNEILVIYTENKKVFIKTKNNDILESKTRLFEFEESLSGSRFARVSNSAIVNLNMVKKMSMDFAGSVKLILKGGHEEFVSRRNIKAIKESLGLGGK